MKTLLNMWLKHDKEVLVHQLKGRLQDEACAPFLENVQRCVLITRFLAGVYKPALNYYVGEKNFIRNKPMLRNQVQHLFAYDKFALRRRMWNTFLLISGDGERRSMLYALKVLLLSRLNTKTDNSGIEYVILQYVECT